MNKDLLEEIERHIDYTNAMEQKSVRDLQLEELYNSYMEQENKINKAIEYLETLKIDDYDGNAYYICDKYNKELGIEGIKEITLEILKGEENEF